MFLSRNKKNNVYPCKPQFYYIRVGFKGVRLNRHVFVMGWIFRDLSVVVHSTIQMETQKEVVRYQSRGAEVYSVWDCMWLELLYHLDINNCVYTLSQASVFVFFCCFLFYYYYLCIVIIILESCYQVVFLIYMKHTRQMSVRCVCFVK